jgi:chaperonin GroEL
LKSKETIAPQFGVTKQPKSYRSLLRGVDKLVKAIQPTLGPLPRLVALTGNQADRSPELIDDGGVIARRIIQLPDRDEDMGAMYLRHLLWRMREDCGDGTATTAVIFNEILQQGVRYIVNGGNAMPLRAYLEKGARLVYDELAKMSRPVEGKDMLVHIAESICYDREMAAMLGEIFETIGEYGHFELRTGNSRGVYHEYTEGSYWEGMLHSKAMINDPAENRAHLENAAVLATDFVVDDLHHLVRMITEAKKAGKTALMLICSTISDACVGFLTMESTRAILPVFAVNTPYSRQDYQMAAIEDIGVLTEAIPMTRQAGETLESVRAENFGQARSVWAKDQFFGIVGGQGDPRKIRRHFASLKKLHASLDNGETRDIVRQRIGKVMGGSAILWVGGVTESEIKVRKDLAERTAEAMRGAMLKGVLPGAGLSFLACKPALQAALQAAQQPGSDPDEAAAYRILIGAMDVPLRAIAANAGLKPDEVMADLKHAGPGSGYDIFQKQAVPAAQITVLDSASVVQAAAYRSITGAALLLTVDVLIRVKKPETVLET